MDKTIKIQSSRKHKAGSTTKCRAAFEVGRDPIPLRQAALTRSERTQEERERPCCRKGLEQQQAMGSSS